MSAGVVPNDGAGEAASALKGLTVGAGEAAEAAASEAKAWTAEVPSRGAALPGRRLADLLPPVPSDVNPVAPSEAGIRREFRSEEENGAEHGSRDFGTVR